MGYDLQQYWSRVATEIASRDGGNVTAGEDDPYYAYKRRKAVSSFLRPLPVDGKRVLEVGCGPGGNLALFADRAAALYGVDISPVMVDLARQRVPAATIHHIDGERLPFLDHSIDVTYTVTVLQHNVEWRTCSALLTEMARVTRERIVLMEDIGEDAQELAGPGDIAVGANAGTDTHIGRRASVYITEMARLGWPCVSTRFLNTAVSRRAQGYSRRLWPTNHREGEPVGWKAASALRLALLGTRFADRVVTDRRDLAQLVFTRS